MAAVTAHAAPLRRTQDTSTDCSAGVPCTLEWAPVCGSNGVTYGNLCAFNVAKDCNDPALTIAGEGECSNGSESADSEACLATIVCTLEYMPVCASNGVAYGNECMFRAQKTCVDSELEIDSLGECDAVAVPSTHSDDEIDNFQCLAGIPCTLEYVPICGSDGFTYGNLCAFNAAKKCVDPKLEKASDGECPLTATNQCLSQTPCTMEFAPVCASDGTTFDNECIFEAHKKCVDPALEKVADGECPSAQVDETDADVEQCLAEIPCTFEYRPVCGTDGETYGNECALKARNKCVDSTLKVVSEGECVGQQ